MTVFTNILQNAVARFALICSDRGSYLAITSTFTLRCAGAYVILICALMANVSTARAQGSRKDDIAVGASGRPIAGATITVCLNGATGAPCSPLAILYTDATLTTPSPNPTQSDDLGHYHFYAAPGRYVVQVSGSGVKTYTMNDTILPNDPSTPAFNSITATSINLGGNLNVGGNARVSGTLSAETFASLSVSTGPLQVTPRSGFQSPSPWIDVSTHGADPSAAIDSTSAIQAAINAACASPGGTVYFPSGQYKVSQPQKPSTSSVFTYPLTCKGLTLQGGSSYQAAGTQFARPPKTSITITTGAHPNMAPVFLFNGAGSSESVTLRDMNITGYNQAVQLYNTAGITFDNVCLTAQYTGNGLRTGSADVTDNTALAIYNTFWIWYRSGCIDSGYGTLPYVASVVMAFVTGSPVPQDNLGLLQMRDTIISGGGIVWDCRTTTCTNGGGNNYFDDVQMENAEMPFYTVSNTAATAGSFQGLPASFNNVQMYDCPEGPQSFVSYNAGGFAAPSTALYLNNVLSCNGAPLLSVGGGSVTSRVSIQGANNGFPSSGANAQVETQAGQAFSSTNQSTCGYHAELLATMYYGCGGAGQLPPLTLFQAGNSNANLGISPYYGYEFADGTHYGYESSFTRNSANTLDVEFAAALAPTGLAGTPTTGGTLANGTYYYSIQAASAGSGKSKSAGSNEISVTLSGSSDAVALSWAVPEGTNPGGCYVYRNTTAGGTFNIDRSLIATIANCTSTTSYTDVGATVTNGHNSYYNSTVAPYYRFAASNANPAGGTVPYFTGTPSGCATWGTGGLLTGTGSICGASAPQTAFIPSPNNAGNQGGPSVVNAIIVVAFWIPFPITISHLTVDIGTADKMGGDLYDVGVYNLSGALQCSWGATSFRSTGMTDNACKQGSVKLDPGYYVFGFTGNSTAGRIYFGSDAGMQLLATATSRTASSGGALPTSISVPVFGGGTPNQDRTYSNVYIALTEN
ncbi:MAG: glycosyl hydrolase family 28-related protein [Candidatus Acidiferrales bacterium]